MQAKYLFTNGLIYVTVFSTNTVKLESTELKDFLFSSGETVPIRLYPTFVPTNRQSIQPCMCFFNYLTPVLLIHFIIFTGISVIMVLVKSTRKLSCMTATADSSSTSSTNRIPPLLPTTKSIRFKNHLSSISSQFYIQFFY